MDRGPFQEGCCKQELIMEKKRPSETLLEITGKKYDEYSKVLLKEGVTRLSWKELDKDTQRFHVEYHERTVDREAKKQEILEKRNKDADQEKTGEGHSEPPGASGFGKTDNNFCFYPYSRTDLTKVH
jgi:hypothetical protein